MSEGYEDQSAFDMGISTLGRINYWLYQANNYNFSNDPPNYYNALVVIYNELTPFLQQKPERLKVHVDLSNACQKYLNIYLNAYNTAKNLNKPFMPPRQAFDSLHEWDRQLRIDLKKCGLLMRLSESSLGDMA